MKSIRLLVLFIPLFLFGLTANAQKTPLEMNDRLIAVTDTLYNLSREWAENLSQGIATHNYTSAQKTRLKMDAYITRETTRLKVLKDIKTSKPFRELIIAFLDYEKNISATAMKPFETVTEATTEEQIQQLSSRLQQASEQEEEYLDKIIKAQAKYAQDCGFTIEG